MRAGPVTLLLMCTRHRSDSDGTHQVSAVGTTVSTKVNAAVASVDKALDDMSKDM